MDLAILPPPYRLALAYAPRKTRAATYALLALDLRLGGVVETAREPMLAQLKLAWWRDRLSEPPAKWPQGEPLLAALAAWDGEARELAGLVDGWEAFMLVGGWTELATGRARAAAALARVLGHPDAVAAAMAAARRWTESELSVENDLAGPWPALPKDLRALAVLEKISGTPDSSKFGRFIIGVRTGLFGR